MNISLKKRTSSGDAKENHEIVKYKAIPTSPNLLLIGDSEIELEQGAEQVPYIEIHKVQFLAFCETDKNLSFIGAFYISDYNNLECRIVTDLPGSYTQDGGYYWIADYKSYIEICELTGENVKPFSEFIKAKESQLIINSLVKINDEYKNMEEV